MPPHDSDADMKIKLYGLLIDQLQKYNSILWQAPARSSTEAPEKLTLILISFS
jgi:hypothetical protein